MSDKHPRDTLVLKAPEGAVILMCPITHVALTNRMAEAVGLDRTDLEDMLARRRPLGISASRWATVISVLRSAASSSYRGPRLNQAPIRLGVGGSAVACFSSEQTALHKKRFPASCDDLRHQIRNSPLHHDKSAADLADLINDAMGVWRSLQFTKMPRAPWFGIMHRLHIEPPPDIDVQVHSDILDVVLAANGRRDPGIIARRDVDRLGRWHPSDVHNAFSLFRNLPHLTGEGVSVDLEYLGPNGPDLFEHRTDWWRIDVPVGPQRPVGLASSPALQSLEIGRLFAE